MVPRLWVEQREVSIDENDRMLVAFRLWDANTEAQMQGLQFVTSPDNWRRIAHKVSDAVYERLTGETGYFDTRIVYVSEGDGPNGEPIRRLAVMDQDGANPSLYRNCGISARKTSSAV